MSSAVTPCSFFKARAEQGQWLCGGSLVGRNAVRSGQEQPLRRRLVTDQASAPLSRFTQGGGSDRTAAAIEAKQHRFHGVSQILAHELVDWAFTLH